MRIYLDTEFTGLHQETTLISIGIIADNGAKFYGELTDYNQSQCDNWIKNNVISNLLLNKDSFGENPEVLDKNGTKLFLGTQAELRVELTEWLTELSPEEASIEVVSDCLAYDMVLFNQIWGHSFNVPKCVHYIYTDICTMFRMKHIDPDISREEFVNLDTEASCNVADLGVTVMKHNSLWDAVVIKECYNLLK